MREVVLVVLVREVVLVVLVEMVYSKLECKHRAGYRARISAQ